MDDDRRIGPDDVVVRPLNVRTRNYRGSVFVGGYQHVMELTEVAAFVWRHIDGHRTVRQLGELVATEYDIDLLTATEDVAELLADLTDHEVLETSTGKSA